MSVNIKLICTLCKTGQKGLLFYLFLKLVNIFFIFSDNVHIHLYCLISLQITYCMATLLLLYIFQPFIWMNLQLTIGKTYLAIKILVYRLSKKQNIFFCKPEVLLITDEKLLTAISNLDALCIIHIITCVLTIIINDWGSFSPNFKLFILYNAFLIDQECK